MKQTALKSDALWNEAKENMDTYNHITITTVIKTLSRRATLNL